MASYQDNLPVSQGGAGGFGLKFNPIPQGGEAILNGRSMASSTTSTMHLPEPKEEGDAVTVVKNMMRSEVTNLFPKAPAVIVKGSQAYRHLALSSTPLDLWFTGEAWAAEGANAVWEFPTDGRKTFNYNHNGTVLSPSNLGWDGQGKIRLQIDIVGGGGSGANSRGSSTSAAGGGGGGGFVSIQTEPLTADQLSQFIINTVAKYKAAPSSGNGYQGDYTLVNVPGGFIRGNGGYGGYVSNVEKIAPGGTPQVSGSSPLWKVHKQSNGGAGYCLRDGQNIYTHQGGKYAFDGVNKKAGGGGATGLGTGGAGKVTFGRGFSGSNGGGGGGSNYSSSSSNRGGNGGSGIVYVSYIIVPDEG